MKSFVRLLLLSLFLASVACATTGPQVRADYDRSADFASYRTFGFYQPLGTDRAGYESLVTQTLKSAVRQQMEARGYIYTENGADLLVNFHARLAPQIRVSQTPAPYYGYYGYRRGFYDPWMGYGYETRVDQYDEGTLNIDLIDAQRKRLIWEGVAVGRVTKKMLQVRETAIRSAVAEIFAQYPFRAGQGG